MAFPICVASNQNNFLPYLNIEQDMNMSCISLFTFLYAIAEHSNFPLAHWAKVITRISISGLDP